jgi:hypothetical protein
VRVTETFLGLIDDRHLFMVIAVVPASELLCVVNFTTHRPPCDESCLVQPGEHPFVTRLTVVSYRNALIKTNADLERARVAALLQMKDPLSAALLTKVRQGALRSLATPRNVKDAVRAALNGPG